MDQVEASQTAHGPTQSLDSVDWRTQRTGGHARSSPWTESLGWTRRMPDGLSMDPPSHWAQWTGGPGHVRSNPWTESLGWTRCMPAELPMDPPSHWTQWTGGPGLKEHRHYQLLPPDAIKRKHRWEEQAVKAAPTHHQPARTGGPVQSSQLD